GALADPPSVATHLASRRARSVANQLARRYSSRVDYRSRGKARPHYSATAPRERDDMNEQYASDLPDLKPTAEQLDRMTPEQRAAHEALCEMNKLKAHGVPGSETYVETPRKPGDAIPAPSVVPASREPRFWRGWR